jgi:hypothetical protein
MDISPVLLWLCLLGSAALVLAGVTSIWSWANQLFNWKFKTERFEAKLAEVQAYNAENPPPKVQIREPKQPKWRRARMQQIAVIRHGYPWGLLLLGAMAYLVYRDFDPKVYVAFGACWFLLTRVRFRQVVKATVKLNRLIHEDGKTPGHALFTHTAQELIRNHYEHAFGVPSFVGEPKKHQRKLYWYYGWAVFRYPVNWLCNGVMTIVKFGWIRKLFHLRLVLPLVIYGALALLWPLWGAITVLYNVADIADHDHDRTEPRWGTWWAWFTPEPALPNTKKPDITPDPNAWHTGKETDAEGDTDNGGTTLTKEKPGNWPEDDRTEIATRTGDGYTYGPRGPKDNRR